MEVTHFLKCNEKVEVNFYNCGVFIAAKCDNFKCVHILISGFGT